MASEKIKVRSAHKKEKRPGALLAVLAFAGTLAAASYVQECWQRKKLRRKAESADQEHLLDGLRGKEKKKVHALIKSCDLGNFNKCFEASKKAEDDLKEPVEPVPDSAISLSGLLPNEIFHPEEEFAGERRHFFHNGLHLTARGKVAVVCLAGGQGTRLGSSDPKGMFNLNLPSQKCLFQLQAERIIRVEKLAAFHCWGENDPRKHIPFVVMTSPATDKKTRLFFAEKENFGLDKSQVHFIVQGQLPCFTEEGKLIMSTKTKMAQAPDGNGGIYAALVESGMLDELEKEGVEYVDTYCVDNALVRVADPIMVGCADILHADVCAAVVAKAYPGERVGVFACRDNRLEIVEYSELPPEDAEARDPGTSRLKYNWANISKFVFTPNFIRRAAADIKEKGRYHIARKEIPSVTGPVQGIKLESFIFDPLRLAHVALLEVCRRSCFAPVKNATGSNDTPASARRCLLDLHREWVTMHGGILELPPGQLGPEISPLRTYMGENLGPFTKNRVISSPYDLILQRQVADEEEFESIMEATTRPERQSSLLRTLSSLVFKW